ncbi:hypothetical protein GCM10029978_063950 [Actinoallomurus acanthiterrae]
MLRINLTRTFFCIKHDIPELRRAGGGAISNIASGGGLQRHPVVSCVRGRQARRHWADEGRRRRLRP